MIKVIRLFFFVLSFVVMFVCKEVSTCAQLDKAQNINLYLYQNATLNFESAVKVSVPFSLDTSMFVSINDISNHVIRVLHPQFIELCEAQLTSSWTWSPDQCVSDLNSQIATWISKECSHFEGFPLHYEHVSPSLNDLGECFVVTTMAYVHISHYRHSTSYLNAGRMIIPRLLSGTGNCIVFFSDKVEFLNEIREIAGELGNKSLITRLLEPFSTTGTGLGNARNAKIGLKLLPSSLSLKNGIPLLPDLGRTLAAAIWFQKLELSALAAEIIPWSTVLQWRDLGNRTDIGFLELVPEVGSILAAVYPLTRSTASLSFNGLAPCAAWAHGSIMVMRTADALIHANAFHANLLLMLAMGEQYLDEEIVLAFAANAGGCATTRLLDTTTLECISPSNLVVDLSGRNEAQCGAPMDIRSLCSHPLVACEENWSG